MANHTLQYAKQLISSMHCMMLLSGETECIADAQIVVNYLKIKIERMRLSEQ